MFTFFKKAETANQTTEVTSESKSTDIRAQWKALAAEKKLTVEDMAALCLYRSILKGEGLDGAISRLKKSFSPITSKVKLENGCTPYGSMLRAAGFAQYSHLKDWLTKEEKEQLAKLGNETYRYKGDL